MGGNKATPLSLRTQMKDLLDGLAIGIVGLIILGLITLAVQHATPTTVLLLLIVIGCWAVCRVLRKIFS
jgi:hypothetical protein